MIIMKILLIGVGSGIETGTGTETGVGKGGAIEVGSDVAICPNPQTQ
jgi:hypothetical protein